MVVVVVVGELSCSECGIEEGLECADDADI
jgi:hypothetical protein